MRGRTILRFLTLTSLLPFSTGCAILFVEGPPKSHRELDHFSCTESRLAPALDLIVAGSAFFGTSEAPYQAPPGYYGQNPPYGVPQNDATGNILGALLYGISGATGLQRVAACRAAKRELEERQAAAATLLSTNGALDRRRPEGPAGLGSLRDGDS
jgi:hypothetical protein